VYFNTADKILLDKLHVARFPIFPPPEPPIQYELDIGLKLTKKYSAEPPPLATKYIDCKLDSNCFN